ncbi:hypothetical protein [Paenibacillus tengchongensis]|uniref:hypothetical protein n=1 Tax=Paenibacillus tengchongensis TaxID=2608684 RepID=UPI00124D0FDE|nr:hypothetical protein [Paenibacillus tengchongensis]
MRKETHEERQQMTPGEQEWYFKAGQRPFAEDGFTPELMTRIGLEAESRSTGAGIKSHKSMRGFAVAGLAAVLLLGILISPLGEWKRESGPAMLTAIPAPGSAVEEAPSAQAAASAQDDGFPPGSAPFEMDGQQYYMPLPLNRDKSRALAVETSAGIVWSPPPPMVNYIKPKLMHNTEPYSIYLTPKGQAELSKDTAQRIYTFPLYAGGSNSYYLLDSFYGAGDYVVMFYGSYTIGDSGNYNGTKLAFIDVRHAAAGESAQLHDILDITGSFSDKPSYIAVDKTMGSLLFVNYAEDIGHPNSMEAEILNLKTGTKRTVDQVSELKAPVLNAKIEYQLDGQKHNAEAVVYLGGWPAEQLFPLMFNKN